MTEPLHPPHHPPVKLTDQEESLLVIARRAALDSCDLSRKVGAVLVDSAGQIVAAACNTLPAGIEHAPELLARPAKYDWTLHAEVNAILDAARSPGKSADGCTMILPWFPCKGCALVIAGSGIQRVVAPYPDLGDPNWGPEFVIALDILRRKGVVFDHFLDIAPPPQRRADGDPAPKHEVDHLRPLQDVVEHWNRHGEVCLEHHSKLLSRPANSPGGLR